MRHFTAVKRTIGVLGLLAVCFTFTGLAATEAKADSAREIDTNVDVTLDRFYEHVGSGRKLVQDAKGVLVFPNVYKAGFGLGGQYGEGALRINGRTADYYNTVQASFGFQIGAQKKSILLLFMQDEALNQFRRSENWKVGAGASVTLVNVGADGSIDTQKLNQPIIAFVIGQKGLMYNLSLQGTKVTKLNKK